MFVLPHDVSEPDYMTSSLNLPRPEAELSHFLVLFYESAQLKARLFLFGFHSNG